MKPRFKNIIIYFYFAVTALVSLELSAKSAEVYAGIKRQFSSRIFEYRNVSTVSEFEEWSKILFKFELFYAGNERGVAVFIAKKSNDLTKSDLISKIKTGRIKNTVCLVSGDIEAVIEMPLQQNEKYWVKIKDVNAIFKFTAKAEKTLLE